MKKLSLAGYGFNNAPLKLILESKKRKSKLENCNIKGLKITKSLKNFDEWDLNNKCEKIKDIQKELEKIKVNKKNNLLKHSFENILLKDDKILKINYNKKNNYSFDFEPFKNNQKNTKNILNKIPHPINKKNKNNDIPTVNKCCINYKTETEKNDDDILPLIEKDKYKINYLNDYHEIINERQNFEFKMHLYIKDLSDYLNEIKNNLKDLYNQEIHIKILNNNMSRRKSAASVLFGFTPKKKEKEKTLKRNDKVNTINYQLSDNISIFNCEGIFNNVKQRNIINRENLIFNKSKIRTKEKEIQKTEKLLIKLVKSITNYYLDILKKNLDIRKDGMIWAVKRLLRVNYIPKKNDFPDFIDDKMYDHVIKISKLKNELFDLIKESEVLKNELINNREFVDLQNRINNTFEDDNNDYDLIVNKNKINNNANKQRYYSADNKNIVNKDKNKEHLTKKKLSYLESKYDKYLNEVSLSKLPKDIQILLFFINNNINLKNNLNKKDISKENNRKSLSLQKGKKSIFKKHRKSILQNKSEIYSKKIKLKNKFIKLNEEEKWNKEIKIKGTSLIDSLKRESNNIRKSGKSYFEQLNINFDTYSKIEKYIILKLKINDTNLNIKNKIQDIEKYLENNKNNKSYNNIYKFIFGDKIK